MTVGLPFPGRGSPGAGPGLDLLDRFAGLASQRPGPVLREVRADGRRLARTRRARPAAHVVDAPARRAAREGGSAPDVVLGHSPGGHDAPGAGASGFADDLDPVRRRAGTTAASPGGAVTAVRAPSGDALRDPFAPAGPEGVEPAGLDTPVPAVPAASRDGVAAAEEPARPPRAVDARRLPVAGAFHSSRTRAAARRFTDVLAASPLRPPGAPVVADPAARPHTAGTAATPTTRSRHPVRRRGAVPRVVRRHPDPRFHRPGPSRAPARAPRQDPGVAPSAAPPPPGRAAATAKRRR
ncbi:hypothetical protein [Saccharothrix algeriensis]|uniref:[acyl-carrier-protein] S-malonyltransferase n=1 Tax=Saccharothrix algeriensis TaxID=173560 RepID=A0ABS2S0V3_9PSEU|nr:hypothetical protein [Saccharothrix algeriensis]MBM7809856.1 [acyl-carrier-protein] S-malonyltransferase [Saccharothrix algeriensis]